MHQTSFAPPLQNTLVPVVALLPVHTFDIDINKGVHKFDYYALSHFHTDGDDVNCQGQKAEYDGQVPSALVVHMSRTPGPCRRPLETNLPLIR